MLAIKRYFAFAGIPSLLCSVLTYYTAMTKVDAQPYEFELEPTSTALVIIDMQRDFLVSGGFGEALGNNISLLRKAIAPTRTVLDEARRRKMLVIHTREGHRPDL